MSQYLDEVDWKLLGESSMRDDGPLKDTSSVLDNSSIGYSHWNVQIFKEYTPLSRHPE